MREYIISDKQLGLIEDFANVCVEGEKLPNIVRCRDCVYICHREYRNRLEYHTCNYFDSEYAEVELDGFCAWGERKVVDE